MMLGRVSAQKYHPILTCPSIGYYEPKITSIKFLHGYDIIDIKFKMA
jgi:hypothetical protein